MNSYLVKLVYQIICGNGEHTAQFDEQLRFVTAPDADAAFRKGQQIGAQEEETFFNQNQQLVQWHFVNVTEVHSLSGLSDGAEVLSQIRETDDAASYCNLVHHKAKRLAPQSSSLSLQIF